MLHSSSIGTSRDSSSSPINFETLEPRLLLSATPTVNYEVQTNWNTGFQGQIEIVNDTGQDLVDWQVDLSFDGQIASIWNAQIEEQNGDDYNISPAGWNSSLTPGQRITFGFVANPDQPGNYQLTSLTATAETAEDDSTEPDPTDPDAPDFSDDPVAFNVTSNWGGGFNGELVITNTSNQAIDAWTLGFDANFDISTLWNGNLTAEADGSYSVTNAVWNGAIAPGASVSVGFGGSLSSGQTPEISNVSLNGTLIGDDEDDDGGEEVVPNLSISDVSVVEGDEGTTYASFDVSLSEPTTQAVTVNYATSDGNATAGEDYVATSGELTIAAGDTSATIAVAINGDTEFEPSESFSLLLSQASNAVITDATGQATITNDDVDEPVLVVPQMSVDDLTITEGDSGTQWAVFTVNLSEATTQEVSLTYATEDGTATAGEDYTASSGTLIIAAGRTQETISVDVHGDTLFESGEYFTLLLSNVLGATLLDGEASATIANDDPNPDPGEPQDYRVVAYFAEWGIYSREFAMADTPSENITHLNYSFVGINDDMSVMVHDHEAFNRNMAEMAELKAANPHLKVLISVGGWTLSSNFSNMSATEANREAFAANLTDFVVQHGFDGADFDWEWPVEGGNWDVEHRPNDGENYVLFLEEMREQLDAQEAIDGRDYEMSVFGPAGFNQLSHFDLDGMAQYLDYFTVQGYDFHGKWDTSRTGHNGPMYENPNDPIAASDKWNVDWVINHYLSEGVDPSKVVMGAPLYGYGWSGVQDGGTNGLYQAASGVGGGTYGSVDASSRGVYDVWDIYNRLTDQPDLYTRYWDDTAQVPYVYAPEVEGGLWITYEDIQSMQVKADYVKDMNLGGMMFWQLDGDLRDFDSPDNLLDFVAGELFGGPIPGATGPLTQGPSTPGVSSPTTNPTPPTPALPDPQTVALDYVSVTASPQGGWNGGYTGQITITNTSDMTLTDWSFSFASNYAIDSGWGGTFVNQGNSLWTLLPPDWDTTLEPGESITLGFQGSETISSYGVFRLFDELSLTFESAVTA